MSAAAVVRLDVVRARTLTRELAAALELSVSLLREAYDGRAWEVLGFDSWDAYCAAELPALRVLVKGLPPVERRAHVAELRGGGMSLRAVSAVTGLAPNTVRTDAAAAGVRLAEVRSLDGSLRSSTAAPQMRAKKRTRPLTDRLCELVAAAPGGLTVRDVTRELRLPQHLASPALCRLAAAGRLEYVRPARRGGLGTYRAASVTA